jgi:hypothetical protein
MAPVQRDQPLKLGVLLQSTYKNTPAIKQWMGQATRAFVHIRIENDSVGPLRDQFKRIENAIRVRDTITFRDFIALAGGS